jgi:hypothetical protein
LCISQRRQLKNGAPLLQHNGGSRTINNYWLLIILAEGQSDRVYLPSGGTAVRSQTTDLMSQGLFEVFDRSDITRTVVPALAVAETTATVGLCSEFTSRYLSDAHAYKNYSKPRKTSSKSAILNSYKSNCLFLLSLFTTAKTFLEAPGTLCSTKSSGLKFRTSRSGSGVTYSCHHNSSRFTFPLVVHSWRSCLPIIITNHATYILTKDTNTFV